MVKPNASTIICRSFEGGKRLSILQQGIKLPDDFLENIIKSITLTPSQGVVLAFCLVHSQYQAIAQLGLRSLQVRLPLLTDISEISDEILQGLRLLCTSNRVISLYNNTIISISPCYRIGILNKHIALFYIGFVNPRSLGIISECSVYFN